jgi:hypothetical protein
MTQNMDLFWKSCNKKTSQQPFVKIMFYTSSLQIYFLNNGVYHSLYESYFHLDIVEITIE